MSLPSWFFNNKNHNNILSILKTVDNKNKSKLYYDFSESFHLYNFNLFYFADQDQKDFRVEGYSTIEGLTARIDSLGIDPIKHVLFLSDCKNEIELTFTYDPVRSGLYIYPVKMMKQFFDFPQWYRECNGSPEASSLATIARLYQYQEIQKTNALDSYLMFLTVNETGFVTVLIHPEFENMYMGHVNTEEDLLEFLKTTKISNENINKYYNYIIDISSKTQYQHRLT